MLPITIVLTEGYSDWEIGPLAGVGRAFYGAEIEFASPRGGALTSAAGLKIAETTRFVPQRHSVVVICGGPAFEQGETLSIANLQSSKEAGSVLAAICGGTLALARAGLLDDVPHTSNAAEYLTKFAPDYRGSKHYVDVPRAVSAAGVITAPAPAPASFAAEVLKAAGLEAGKADEIRRMLGAEHGA